MGAVVDRLDLSVGSQTELDTVKDYLRVSHATEDDFIISLIAQAKQMVDDFLQNPFVELRTEIQVASVAIGDAVAITPTRYVGARPTSGGLIPDVGRTIVDVRFVAAATADHEEREFAVGVSDAATATNLAAAISDELYGLREVTATAVDTTVRLVRSVPGRQVVPATSSNDDTLKVVQRRVESDIPTPVADAVLRIIGRVYEQRAEGEGAGSMTGLGNVTWEGFEIVRTMLSPHRKIVGL